MNIHKCAFYVWMCIHLCISVCVCVCVCVTAEEDQETSGDFGSGGAVILLDDQEDEEETPRVRQKERRGRLHPRGTIEDDEDEGDDKDDEIGYLW